MPEADATELVRPETLPPRFAGGQPRPASPKAVRGLLVLTCFYTLYFAKDLFLPIILALLLYFIFRPAVRRLRSVGIPSAIAALFVLAGLVATGVLATYHLAGPAAEWLAKAPLSFREIDDRIAHWKEPVEQMTRAAEEAQQLAQCSLRKRRPGGGNQATKPG